MRKISIALVIAALSALAGACGTHTSYVAADQAALGRVVVYRNGVAFYERHAAVDGDRLVLQVPQDKIDDFLKSLTVVDAKTKESLPVSFPSPGQARGGQVEMVIQLPDRSHRDVVLSYVTESPAWKPTYRVTVGEGGKIDLQGWAIVDNTSGEDWKAVQVGVGSSSALSFRFDLHSIRVVHRETLHSNDAFAKAPPMGGSVGSDGASREVVLAAVLDDDIARPEGHPDVADEAQLYKPSAAMGTRGGGGNGAAQAAAESPRPTRYRVERADKSKDNQQAVAEERKVEVLARQVMQARQKIIIEGYANAGEADAEDKALDRANMMRNQLIERGVPPAQVKAVSRGVVSGQKAGVRLVTSPVASQSGKTDESDAPAVGESHFDSRLPMTVAKGTSAMVSIVQGQAQGDVVYLYDAESPGGNARYAFKAVRFRNPTTSTLESGPITVYGAGRFVGEGLSEPIPPGANAVIPYALDRQIVVDRDGSNGDRMSKLVKLNRGVLTAEVQHLRKTRLKLANRSHLAATVLVKHATPKGWSITKGPKVTQQLGDSHLFAVEIPAGESRVLEVEEATPMTRTVDVRSNVGVDMLRVYLQTAKEDPAIEGTIKRLLGLFDDMAKAQEQIVHLRERGEEYRSRMDELHDQIISLKLVKTAGTLMNHLQHKMREMSDKVQQTTIDVVAAQEQLMVARVRFHDEVAEISLDHRPALAIAK